MLSIFKSKKAKRTEVNVSFKRKIGVTCPNCNINYNVDKVETQPIRCMDCGCTYNQKTHCDNVIDWIREKIITVGAC